MSCFPKDSQKIVQGLSSPDGILLVGNLVSKEWNWLAISNRIIDGEETLLVIMRMEGSLLNLKMQLIAAR